MTDTQSPDPRTRPKLEVYHSDDAVDVDAKVIRYVKPQQSRPRHVVNLFRTDTMLGIVQVIAEGGESTLHSHPNMDGLWFVLGGRARFYTTDDCVIAELGPHEAVLIPRRYPYWFESAGHTELEILQVEAFTRPGDPIKLLRLSGEAAAPDFETSQA
jgi:mannose-6-phosphate isomerase-like protein (cupin superfamily)